MFLLEHEGRIALHRRPERGLLAGMWELPNTDGRLTAEEALEKASAWGCEPLAAENCGDAVHIFTHIEWHMTGWRIPCGAAPGRFRWTDADDRREDCAVPTAFRYYTSLL